MLVIFTMQYLVNKQWGYHNTKVINVLFSISCTKTFGIVANEYTSSSIANNTFSIRPDSITSSGFSFQDGTREKAWIALCKQQWGVNTKVYSLAFNKIFSIAVSNGSSAATGLTFRSNPYNITNTNFQIYIMNDFRWLAIGKQQWGKLDGNDAKWSYPLTVSELLYVQVAGDYLGIDGVQSGTKQSFITFANSSYLWFRTDYAKGTNRFVVIGVQQWGKIFQANQVNFSLTFNYIYCIIPIDLGSTKGAQVTQLLSNGVTLNSFKFYQMFLDNTEVPVENTSIFWLAVGQ